MSSELSRFGRGTPPENTPDTSDVGRENIIEGRGLEEIERVGWQQYRDRLAGVSYAEIIERYLEQQDQTSGEQPGAGSPEWMVHNANVEGLSRALQLGATLESQNTAVVPFQLTRNNKKITAHGRELARDEQGYAAGLPVRRIYFAPSTARAAEAYKLLLDSLTDSGVISKVGLALNLENYQGESLDRDAENNTIILYAYGDDAQLMEDICRSIKKAKEQSPQTWKLSQRGLRKVKEDNLMNFMIPLDDTTAFVEMDSEYSYHAGPWGQMYRDIVGDRPQKGHTLQLLLDKLKQWTPQRPGMFSVETGQSKRRRYNPALLYEQAS